MKKNSYLKRVFGNSTWIIASKLINIVIGLAVNVCITRYLGAEQKGAMAEAQAIAGFFGFIASFGILDIIILKFTKDRDNSATVAATGMALMFCGGLIAFILAVFSDIAMGADMEVLTYVGICAFVYIFQCLSIYEYWFYSNLNSKHYAIAQSVIHIVFLGVRLVGMPLKADLMYFIIVTSLETIVVYLSLPICYKKTKRPFIGRFLFDKKIAHELLKLALPMIVMGFATTIYMKVDQIMVGKLMGNVELGLYSVAVNLAEYWYFVPAAIYTSFLPVITESVTNKIEFRKRLQQFTDIMVFIGYLAAIGVMLFGHWVIVLLFGNEFEGSAYILMVYIWSGVFTCLSYSGQVYFIIKKDTKTIMWINIFGAILNLGLNMILIKLFGSIGAAFATLIQYMIIAFGQMLLLRKQYGELYLIQFKALFPFARLLGYSSKVIKRSNKRE